MAYPNPTQPIIISVSKAFTPQASTYLRTFCAVSCGDTSLGAGNSKTVDSSNYTTTINASTETRKFADAFFAQNSNKTLLVFEVGSSGGAQANLQLLETFIDNKVGTAYMYYIPNRLFADNYFATVATKYAKPDVPVYFCVNLAKGDASSDTNFNRVKGLKSVFGMYPNCSDTNWVASGIPMGVMASYAYDISVANKMQPLNNKIVTAQVESLKKSDIDKIVQVPASFLYKNGTSTLLENCLFADGEPFSYWYSWDNTMSIIESSISTAIINSSNIANSTIPYNERGIDILSQNIINALALCKDLNYITSFGAGYDLGTKSIIGINTIGSIPFSEYKASNPEDYKQGIYNGFTIYVEVCRYIRQIKINATLA